MLHQYNTSCLFLRAIPYKPQPILNDSAQSTFSDLAHFQICDRGKCLMNFGENRFKKY